jgi:hypothetical protein
MADEPRGDLAEVVDRAWDAWLRDGAIDPALERRDPALARTLRRVATLEPAPAPSPAFAARLQTELLGPPTPALRLRAATPR